MNALSKKSRYGLGAIVSTSLLVATFALVAPPTVADAAPIGQTSTSFTCTTHDEDWGDNVCFCEGGRESLDCLAMKSQCKSVISCTADGSCACTWDLSMTAPDEDTRPGINDFDLADFVFAPVTFPMYYSPYGAFSTFLYF